MPVVSIDERACKHCGCTEFNACPGGCAWVSADECSECRPDKISMGRATVVKPRKPGKKRRAR